MIYIFFLKIKMTIFFNEFWWKQEDFWTDTENAVKRAYYITDNKILDQSFELGRGGSTAVTAILINGQKLVVANVGDSRAVISKNGKPKQLSIDHEPSKEKKVIESRGGFVSNIPGRYLAFSSVYNKDLRFVEHRYEIISMAIIGRHDY